MSGRHSVLIDKGSHTNALPMGQLRVFRHEVPASNCPICIRRLLYALTHILEKPVPRIIEKK